MSVPDNAVNQAIARAAALLEREGWHQGISNGLKPGYGLVEALNKTADIFDIYDRAYDHVVAVLNQNQRSLVAWNDAEVRRRDDVIALLRKASITPVRED